MIATRIGHAPYSLSCLPPLDHPTTEYLVSLIASLKTGVMMVCLVWVLSALAHRGLTVLPVALCFKNLERETGFEPATFTLAR
jgi:hypothetical protein